MESRSIVSILGRERDFETGEFGKEFRLSRLRDERQSAPVFAAIWELTIAKAGLAVFNKGVPASSDVDRFSSHKVYE